MHSIIRLPCQMSIRDRRGTRLGGGGPARDCERSGAAGQPRRVEDRAMGHRGHVISDCLIMLFGVVSITLSSDITSYRITE